MPVFPAGSDRTNVQIIGTNIKLTLTILSEFWFPLGSRELRSHRLHLDSGGCRVSWESIMQNYVERFVKDESGATAIEYGLIAALIAVGIIAAARGLGSQISATFNTVTGTMKSA